MSQTRYTVVRDPVHGDIYMTDEELRILDTPQMQRLRGIRQLGTAHLVYPGAQHTRFEHSLGTLHLTQQLVDAINLNRSLAPGALLGIADDEARILRAAALVHDVTHIPFGHSIEDQSGILERHDTNERFLAALDAGTEVGRALERMGVRDEVLAVLLPEDEPGVPSVPPCWREILSDTICADNLDYLKRDAYYTGLNLLYDARVTNYFKVDRASGHLYVDLEKRGLVRQDMLSELLRVLDARYFFSERVYYHHAKDAAGAMIAATVEAALLEGHLAPESLRRQTDDSLLAVLENHPPPTEDAAARHRELISRLRSRRLLKRACVYPRYANREVQSELVARFFSPGKTRERRALEQSVQQQLADRGIDPPVVVLYCPARRMQLKEAMTHVRFPNDERIRPLAEHADAIPHLAQLERSYRDLWKMYVLAGSDDRRVLSAIGEIADELLPNATNVYDPTGR